MNAITYERHEQDWDGYEEPEEEARSGRPRRQFFNRKTAALAALITCALGFYAGVRIEKGQLSGSTTASAGGSAAVTAAGGGPPAAAGGGSAPGRGTGSRTGAARFGGGNASVGSVSSVRSKTLYLSDVSGNTVKVALSSATKISKSVTVASRSIRPGDTVVIQGLRNSRGTVIATSVTDSGASTTGGGTSSAGSSNGANSVGGLFAPGGPPAGFAPGGPGGG
jgi:Domain of unknown function (DUF5666)